LNSKYLFEYKKNTIRIIKCKLQKSLWHKKIFVAHFFCQKMTNQGVGINRENFPSRYLIRLLGKNKTIKNNMECKLKSPPNPSFVT